VRGDWRTASLRVERYIAAARAGHITGFLSTALAASAWILVESGEPGETALRIDEARPLLDRQAANGIGNIGGSYCSLGRACLALGRVDEARAFGQPALALSQSLSGVAAHALHLLADVAASTNPGGCPGDGDGEALYRQALSLAEPRGMRPLEARCHAGLSVLYRSMGRRDEAAHHGHVSEAIQRGLG
jgi:tetratricopeptide (TPR) repeat protein